MSALLSSQPVLYSVMRITNKQITDFAETHDMVALAGDMFEDAGGNVIHEAEVVDMIIDESGCLKW